MNLSTLPFLLNLTYVTQKHSTMLVYKILLSASAHADLVCHVMLVESNCPSNLSYSYKQQPTPLPNMRVVFDYLRLLYCYACFSITGVNLTSQCRFFLQEVRGLSWTLRNFLVTALFIMLNVKIFTIEGIQSKYCQILSNINKHQSHVCRSPDRDATLSARWTRQFETMLDVSCFLWKCFHYHFLFLPRSYKLLLTESILLSSAPSCERSEL